MGVSPNGFVIAQADGLPLQPRSLTHECGRVLVKTKLPRIRFRSLGHFQALQVVAAGVHPKIASAKLGHSTLDFHPV